MRKVPLRSDDESKWKLSQLQELAQIQKPPIDLTYMVSQVVQGWEAKAKGLFQVLWEHGWVNENEITKYKVSVGEDVNQEYSLQSLMSNCEDF